MLTVLAVFNCIVLYIHIQIGNQRERHSNSSLNQQSQYPVQLQCKTSILTKIKRHNFSYLLTAFMSRYYVTIICHNNTSRYFISNVRRGK